MANRRVVVTGLGLITPLGIGVKENWTNLLACKTTGFTKLTQNEYKDLPCRIAACVDQAKLDSYLLESNILKKSELKAMSTANVFSILSADEALKDAEWTPANESAMYRAGTSIATGMAGISEVSELAVNLTGAKGYKSTSPYFIPKILPNLSSGLVSIRFKLKGPNHCVTTACAAGTHAIADAYSFIKSGHADVMVCGATEACIHPVSLAGFSRMRALATSYNDRPHVASRPFDTDREGFVMSEGAGCIVLESLEHALNRRRSKIYAEVLGYGLNADANHITNPSTNGDGAFRCMQSAVEHSNVRLEDVNYVNVHATSTPVGDLAEINAIKRLFKQTTTASSSSKTTFISSLKGSLGHLLGAAGAVETIFTILACNERVLPASANISNLDPALELHQTPNLKIIQNEFVRLNDDIIAIKNSFGFGGTNASLCLRSFKL